MDFKIIPVEKYEAEVCLYRDTIGNSYETVKLKSFIADVDEKEVMLSSTVMFDTVEMAQSFIDDYSEESAESWIESMADRDGVTIFQESILGPDA